MPIRNILITAVSLLIILFSLPASASKNYPLRERLVDYSIQFAGEVTRSSADVKKLRDVKRKEISDSVAYETMRTFGREMYMSNRQTMAFEYFKQMLEILDDTNEISRDGQIFKTYCYLVLGSAADEAGMQQLSMEYYLKGLDLTRRLDTSPYLGDFYNNIGVCYSKSNDSRNAESYFNKALETNVKRGMRQRTSVTYRNLSEVRMKSGDLDGAVDYAIKAVDCLDEKKEPDDYYSLQAHLGFLHLQRHELDVAYTWLSNAYRHQLKRDAKVNLFETCLMLMNLYATMNKQDSLDRYSKETERLVDEINNPALRARFYDGMARLYYARGEKDKAFQLAQQLIILKDSVYHAENLARMEQAHGIYQIEKEALEKEYSMEKWNPVVVFFTMGSVVLLMAGMLVWVVIIRHRSERMRREKDKADALLAEMRELSLRQEREQKERAERDLNEQQRRLTAVTLEKIKTSQQIDEALTEVKQALLKVSPRDHETQQKLRTAISRLEGLDNEANWEEFLHYFTMVHPAFYRRLDERHPGLTPKDRKLCALISLGLSTKDIASLTFRELRSVETSRNRLRKRLELSSDVNLEDYMHHFTSEC